MKKKKNPLPITEYRGAFVHHVKVKPGMATL